MKVKVELNISCCSECPFRRSERAHDDYCNFPSKKKDYSSIYQVLESGYNEVGFPKLCPLLKLLSIKEKTKIKKLVKLKQKLSEQNFFNDNLTK